MTTENNIEQDKALPIWGRVSRTNWIFLLVGVALTIVSLFLIDSDLVIAGTGTVGYQSEVPVFAARGGVVASVSADEGDEVEQGQVILTLEDPAREEAWFDLEGRLADAESAAVLAETALREWEIRPGEASVLVSTEKLVWLERALEARKDVLEGFEDAFDRNLVTEVEVRREQIALLEAEMALLEARALSEWRKKGLLELGRERLEALRELAAGQRRFLREEKEWLRAEREKGSIRAPIAGRLVTLDFRYTGMFVPEGAFVGEIVDETSPYEVEALIGERNIDLLRPGGTVRLRSTVAGSLIGDEFQGRVSELPLAPERGDSPGGPLFEVEVAVGEVPFRLVPGSTVEVEFVLGRRTLIQAILDSLSGRNARKRLQSQGSDQEGGES